MVFSIDHGQLERKVRLTGTLRLTRPRVGISIARRIVWRLWSTVWWAGKIVR